MIKRALRLVFTSAKYGSGLLLFLFDLAMVALIAVDVIRFKALDLDYLSIVQSSDLLWSFSPEALVKFIVLLALPVFLALLGNFFSFKYAPGRYYKHATTTRTKIWCLVLHGIVVTACVTHSNVTDDLRETSGMCGPIDGAVYCFNSSLWFVDDFQLYLLSATILLPLLSMIAKDTLWKNKELSTEFDFWRLIGAVGEYQPAYGDEIIYVNSASMAPSIRAVNAATTAYHSRYQRAVPTSDEARRLLLEKAEDARERLYGYLLGHDNRRKKVFNIEFFPGTSRTLEAGMLRLRGISHVVLSPYEHFSQADVIRWVCETQGRITCTPLLPESPAFFQEQWRKQKSNVCKAIEQVLVTKQGERVAVVVSEVNYITGVHVQVAEIIDDLRGNFKDLVFIIDGSQAVGNLSAPLGDLADHMEVDDFYYFSAHKWLLSPNTCGVLVSHAKNSQAIQPYDMFGFSLPTSTIDPNTVFGLVSALEFLFDRRKLFDRFSARSREAKSYFRELVGKPDSRIEIVESATSEINASLFLAVRPRLGYRWMHKNRIFWTYMRERGVDLTVIPQAKPYFEAEPSKELLEMETYLLRVSFPYFLIGRNVKSLLDHLNAVIVKAN